MGLKAVLQHGILGWKATLEHGMTEAPYCELCFDNRTDDKEFLIQFIWHSWALHL